MKDFFRDKSVTSLTKSVVAGKGSAGGDELRRAQTTDY
jgi:hypothetical protein